MKILLFGSTGQLGQTFLEKSSLYPDLEILFLSRKDVDFSNVETFSKFSELVKLHNPDVCINCVAYTSVDDAEENSEQTYKINTQAVYDLVQVCKLHNILLIHFSTDYVFDGHNSKPYLETDFNTPLNIYGYSKLQADWLILSSNVRALIFRVSWLYSPYGKNFVKTIISLSQTRKELNVVYDQISSPTSTYDLVKVVLDWLIDGVSEEDLGLYNFSNVGNCSWYNFASSIVQTLDVDCKVNPIESKDFPQKAKRPTYSYLNKEKIQNVRDIKIPYWEESLKTVIDKI